MSSLTESNVQTAVAPTTTDTTTQEANPAVPTLQTKLGATGPYEDSTKAKYTFVSGD